ncbi:hypothetical protein NPIL_439971 [Nephila pilipes]|uniref:C2H2-type domain-containing protein n=1 Tax=Nephila pilipes TaxID=299642 RepID=A0A8X6QCX6_NEPPI|nr:hypothetical protein NPIL_439971 [Nephila pilipes]
MDSDSTSSKASSKDKSFECNICERSFSRFHRLQSHLRSHKSKKIVKQKKNSVKVEAPSSPTVSEEKEHVNENIDTTTVKQEDPQSDDPPPRVKYRAKNSVEFHYFGFIQSRVLNFVQINFNVVLQEKDIEKSFQ